MTVKELQKHIARLVADGKSDEPVVIHLTQPSVGVRAHTAVWSINTGFDWDAGMVWIEPEEDLLSKRKDRDTPLQALRITFTKEPRTKRIIKCPKCEEHLRTADKYCPRCGQAISVGSYREIKK